MKEFKKLLYKAIADLLRHGFDSAERLRYWKQKLRTQILKDIGPVAKYQERLREGLKRQYDRAVHPSRIATLHPQIEAFDIHRLAPSLQMQLSKRIHAATDLIKLDRENAVEKTLQRFEGWVSSIPEGGTRRTVAKETATHISKPLYSMKYNERRLHIDQAHKLISAIDRTVAENTGAIAMKWRSHWRQKGYNYREDHKERDDHIYLLRDSWAMDKGYIAKGSATYTDEITAPGEEVFCRCKGIYLHSLSQLPSDLLTAKGKRALEEYRHAST